MRLGDCFFSEKEVIEQVKGKQRSEMAEWYGIVQYVAFQENTVNKKLW